MYLRSAADKPIRLPPRNHTKAKRLYDMVRDQQAALDRIASAYDNRSESAISTAVDAYSRALREVKSVSPYVCSQ
jgi:hypothetical protein